MVCKYWLEWKVGKLERQKHDAPDMMSTPTLLALTPAGVVHALNPRPFLSFPKVAILTVKEHSNPSD